MPRCREDKIMQIEKFFSAHIIIELDSDDAFLADISDPRGTFRIDQIEVRHDQFVLIGNFASHVYINGDWAKYRLTPGYSNPRLLPCLGNDLIRAIENCYENLRTATDVPSPILISPHLNG